MDRYPKIWIRNVAVRQIRVKNVPDLMAHAGEVFELGRRSLNDVSVGFFELLDCCVHERPILSFDASIKQQKASGGQGEDYDHRDGVDHGLVRYETGLHSFGRVRANRVLASLAA